MNQNKRDRIAARAHEIWEREGRPPDKAEEHWHRAEQELAREERSAQMGGAEAPPSELDTRPAPPVDAAPPLDGAETRPAETTPEPASEKTGKRKSGRSRRPRTESQQG
jgi:hypothetical protein